MALADQPHPVHTFIKPLHLSLHAATNKYHNELPWILTHSGAQAKWRLFSRCEIVNSIDIFIAPNPSNPNATPSGSASITPLVNEKMKKNHLSDTIDPLLAAVSFSECPIRRDELAPHGNCTLPEISYSLAAVEILFVPAQYIN
jgi:hypothetical protein